MIRLGRSIHLLENSRGCWPVRRTGTRQRLAASLSNVGMRPKEGNGSMHSETHKWRVETRTTAKKLATFESLKRETKD